MPIVDPLALNSWCQGNLYYDEIEQGDGLQAVYFDNEVFQGESVKNLATKLDFNWGGDPPIPHINGNSFSLM